MLNKIEKEYLDKLFYEYNNFIFGLNKFNDLVNKGNKYISQEKIRYYYKNQEITQLFKSKVKIINKITESNRPYNKMYCDSMYITDLNITILNILDFYSRYNYVFIFKLSKQLTSKKASNCLLSVIEDSKEKGYNINKIICDNGSEFLGNFNKLCKNNKIIIDYTYPGDKTKTSPIESFNRTMRSMIEKYKIINKVDASNIFKIIKLLNNIYNNSYHSIIKEYPNDILNNFIEKKKIELPKIEKYNIGDSVRIYIKDDMNPFNKLSPLWSREIYLIESYNNKTGYYKLKNNNTRYKYTDLQKIDKENLMIFNNHH